MIDYSNIVRQILDGTTAVASLIPQQKGHSATQHEIFLSRASLFNVTERTLSVFLGLLFSKAYSINDQTIDLVAPQTSLKDFAENMAKESLIGGQIGVLVDIKNNAPYLKLFNDLQIKSIRIDENGELIRVLLIETVDLADVEADEPQYGDRELRLYLKNGKCHYRLGNEEEQLFIVNGGTINFIPFYLSNYKDVGFAKIRSPLQSLAETNFQHFYKDLILSHALELIGRPTTVLIDSRITPDNERVVDLGPEYVINLPQGSSASFLELNGNSIVFLENQLKNLLERMLLLGTNLLTSQKNVGESAEAIRLTQAGEISVLESLAGTLSQGLSKILTIFNLFRGSKTEVKFELHSEIIAKKIDEKTALLYFQNNIIDMEDMREIAKKIGFINPDKDLKTYEEVLFGGEDNLKV